MSICTRAYCAKNSIWLNRKNLLLGSAAVALLASPAYANPLGGTVTTGSATISTPSSKNTTVNQKSQSVVIDWSSFNIGSGQTTQFVQPNKNAIAVNRIGSASASQILGTLDANGRVVLINGNGLLFGKNAQVNVGSLVATSTDGSDADVLAGKFTRAGSQSASIDNRGSITAVAHGTVALVAPNVTNKGNIEAKLGTVSLGGANAFTVDFKGDGLVSFATQGDVNAAAKIVNTGKLVGANVAMTAHAAEGIATSVVSTNGIIEAQTAHGAGSTILLDAGNGSLKTTGTIDAAGKTGGGAIETSGNAVSIGGKINAGKGGSWKVDPDDLTIDSTAATTIDNALNGGTSVLEQTTSGAPNGYGNDNPSGNGDLFVDSALSWGTNATLTLDAYHSLNINAPISITGAGNLVLQYNDAATDGALSFDLGPTGFGGSVSYGGTNNGGSLTINSTNYDLLYAAGNLENINTNSTTRSGSYALADSIDLTGVSWTPIGANAATAFTGAFEGLGNTISNLNLNTSAINAGLFGYSNGPIRDIGVVNGSVTGTAPNGNVALLAGFTGAGGTIMNAYATGSVNGVIDTGGLVGSGDALIANSWTNVTVTGSQYFIGGLVGVENGTTTTISNSHAEGSVNNNTSNANEAGGLVGQVNGVIQNSYATGNVTSAGAFAGGLIGSLLGTGNVSNSYATGNVSVPQEAGGFAGLSQGTITNSFANGTVTGKSFVGGFVGNAAKTISGSYATGDVTALAGGTNIGGFAGATNAGTISNNYATGSVTGSNTSDVGGFDGLLSGTTLQDNYSIGAVTGTGTNIGGFLGTYYYGTEAATNYWDTQTSGQMKDGVGGATPMTTAQLQSGLPTGFSNTAWSIIPNVSFPYLSWQFNGTPQIVSGIVTVAGGAGNATDKVTLLANGVSVTPLSTAFGVNGYYYNVFAPGTIATGSDLLAYLSAGYTNPGNAVVEDFNSAATMNIREGLVQVTTDQTTASGVLSGLNTAYGANTGSQFLYSQAGGFTAGTDLTDTAASFDVDAALNLSGSTLKLVTSGAISESTGSITAKELCIDAHGDIILGNTNTIATLGGFTTGQATGNININDTSSISVAAKIDAGFGTGTLTLTTPGKITETSAGDLDAGTLTGSSGSGAILTSTLNNLAAIGNFTNSGTTTSTPFTLDNDKSFAITGSLNAGYEADLISAGTITETGSGLINATELLGSSVGGTTLNGNNVLFQTEAFTNTGTGGFALTDTRRLSVLAPLSAGNGDANIIVTNGILDVAANITANDITLTSALDEVKQTAGSMTATGVITVNAYDGIILDGGNSYTSENLHTQHGIVTGN